MDEPERVEVELTAHEPAARFARPGRTGRSASGASSSGGPAREAPPTGPTTGDTPRLVAGAAAIGLVGLLIGFVVGRLGGDGAVTSEPTPVTGAAAITTTTELGANTDTLPLAEDALVTSTTSPRPTVTVPPGSPSETELQVSEGSIGVTAAIADMPVEIVALMSGGHVMRIDLPTGTTWSTTGRAAQLGPAVIHAGDGWILVPSFDEREGSMIVLDDGVTSSLDTGLSWPMLESHDEGRFWRGDDSSDGSPRRLLETSVDGGDTGVEIDLQGYFPRMVDPLGGVVVDAPGGSFVLRPDSSTRVTTGRVLALGLQRGVVHDCDDEFTCGYAVIERATGQRREVVLDPSIGDGATLDPGGWWTFARPMGPNEDRILVAVWDQQGAGRQRFGVLDLDTGGYTEIGSGFEVPPMRWGPEGRFVFWVDRGRLAVFDPATGASTSVADDLGTVRAFTIRPSTVRAAAADANG